MKEREIERLTAPRDVESKGSYSRSLGPSPKCKKNLSQVRMQRVVVRRANLAPAVQPASAVQLGTCGRIGGNGPNRGLQNPCEAKTEG